MKELDFRWLAEQEVKKFHIFDKEWEEILIEEYVAMLMDHMAPREGIEPSSAH